MRAKVLIDRSFRGIRNSRTGYCARGKRTRLRSIEEKNEEEEERRGPRRRKEGQGSCDYSVAVYC